MLGKQYPFKDVRYKLDTHLHSHSVGKNRVISSCKDSVGKNRVISSCKGGCKTYCVVGESYALLKLGVKLGLLLKGRNGECSLGLLLISAT